MSTPPAEPRTEVKVLINTVKDGRDWYECSCPVPAMRIFSTWKKDLPGRCKHGVVVKNGRLDPDRLGRRG